MRPKKTILCVDDNEQALSVRKFMLDTRGYRVLTALTGVEAIELVSQGGIDLVLSDLIMPQMDGNELVRRIKQMAPDMPTLLISGTVKAFDRASNADAFMPKGCCSPLELLERIRLMIARKRGPKKHAPYRAAADPNANPADLMDASRAEVSSPAIRDARDLAGRIPSRIGNGVAGPIAASGVRGPLMMDEENELLDPPRASHSMAVAVASCRVSADRSMASTPTHTRRS